MVCFSALLHDRVLTADELVSPETIRNNIVKLGIIDHFRESEKYEANFQVPSSDDEFQFITYVTTDDTKQGKNDKRHVGVAVNYDKDSDDGFHIEPYFDLLTTAPSSHNSDSNVEVLKETLPRSVLHAFGGGTADNAGDAQKEIVETFGLVMEAVAIDDRHLLNGVERRPLVLNDSFHNDQLAIVHCSRRAAGQTVRGDSRFCHHRGMLQEIHDVAKVDRNKSNAVFDAICRKHNIKGKRLLTYREREARWFVNGRYATNTLDLINTMAFEDEIEYNLLELWCLRMRESEDGWRLTALDEILTWMKMDTIIINLTMEAELVDYFEVTAAWHSSTGEISSRPGFRSLELHHLLFDYILPWWEGASENPASRFPRTSALIQKLLDNPGTKDLGETKLDQLKEGIAAGKKEIMKVYSTLMTAPMIFTTLSDPLRGPSILRAVIEIIRESETELADVDDDEWAEMNSEEDSLDLVFYNILGPQARMWCIGSSR